jgi:hypothetical protein
VRGSFLGLTYGPGSLVEVGQEEGILVSGESMRRPSVIAMMIMAALAADVARADPVTFRDPVHKVGFPYDTQRWSTIDSLDPNTVIAIVWKNVHDRPVGGCALQIFEAPFAKQIKRPLAGYREDVTKGILFEMQKDDPNAAILESKMREVGGRNVIRLQRKIGAQTLLVYTLETFRGMDEIRFDCFTPPHREIGPRLFTAAEFETILTNLIIE